MKTEDIERLEKMGYDVKPFYDENVFIISLKKDPWDGVEYARCVKKSLSACFKEGFIYRRVPGTSIDEIDCLYYGENWTGSCAGAEIGTRGHFTPSTESEYVEQLAIEWDNRLGQNSKEQIDYSDIGIHPIANKTVFVYNKIHDTLHWCGVPVYCAGKWAKVVENPVTLFKFSGVSDTVSAIEARSDGSVLVYGKVVCKDERIKALYNKPESNWCQSCNEVFSDDLVEGKCTECRPKLCWTCGIGDVNKDIVCNNPECSNFPFK